MFGTHQFSYVCNFCAVSYLRGMRIRCTLKINQQIWKELQEKKEYDSKEHIIVHIQQLIIHFLFKNVRKNGQHYFMYFKFKLYAKKI